MVAEIIPSPFILRFLKVFGLVPLRVKKFQMWLYSFMCLGIYFVCFGVFALFMMIAGYDALSIRGVVMFVGWPLAFLAIFSSVFKSVFKAESKLLLIDTFQEFDDILKAHFSITFDTNKYKGRLEKYFVSIISVTVISIVYMAISISLKRLLFYICVMFLFMSILLESFHIFIHLKVIEERFKVLSNIKLSEIVQENSTSIKLLNLYKKLVLSMHEATKLTNAYFNPSLQFLLFFLYYMILRSFLWIGLGFFKSQVLSIAQSLIHILPNTILIGLLGQVDHNTKQHIDKIKSNLICLKHPRNYNEDILLFLLKRKFSITLVGFSSISNITAALCSFIVIVFQFLIIEEN
ncbi:CLUMA_CG007892, isoform A [Clunio marinus]|uniref:CLUMA_CG007892, isoform A n=1 Tax=Clunio marinus TaxID=568069 RepID=A0A1J1I216_9DIPT|nr:CLUMA_CG007892, isoform A [Clunio marinus]